MNKAEQAALELKAMDELAAKDSPMHSLHALSKLFVALLYIFTVVSFHKYDFSGLFVMVLFPVLGYQFSFIPMRTCFYKLRIVLPLVCAVGLFNPLLDRQLLFMLGNLPITGGVVSMLTLMMKGIFCLMASFLLVATTSIDEICRALRLVRFPALLTSLLLLTFRYTQLLLEEVSILTQAYHLRAPRQKGIQFRAWGSFLGQLLLRSMDRAESLYESMLLRGFQNEFHYAKGKTSSAASWPFALLSACLIVLARFYNLPSLLLSLVL